VKDKEKICEEFDKMVMQTRTYVEPAEQGVTIVRGFRDACISTIDARVKAAMAALIDADPAGMGEQEAMKPITSAVRDWNDVWNYVAGNAGMGYMAKDGFLGFMKKRMAGHKDHNDAFFRAAKFL